MISRAVDVVVVTHNSAPFIGACIESIYKSASKANCTLNLNVIDSKSTDETCAIVQSFSEVTLVELSANQGYVAANNLGVSLGKNPYIALVNPDAEIHHHWFSELLDHFERKENSDLGIAVGKIYLGKSKNFDSAGSLYNNILNAWSRGAFERDQKQYEEIQSIPMATPCAFLMKREILEHTYLFDKDFFMYMEEVDFSLRVRNAGFDIQYVPTAIAHHHKSKSLKGSAKKRRSFKQYHGTKNRAKMLGLYFHAGDWLRNGHLVFLSFAYTIFSFLRQGQVHLALFLLWHIPRMLIKGVQGRTSLHRKTGWRKYIKKMNLKNMMDTLFELRRKEDMFDTMIV